MKPAAISAVLGNRRAISREWLSEVAYAAAADLSMRTAGGHVPDPSISDEEAAATFTQVALLGFKVKAPGEEGCASTQEAETLFLASAAETYGLRRRKERAFTGLPSWLPTTLLVAFRKAAVRSLGQVYGATHAAVDEWLEEKAAEAAAEEG